MRKNQIKFNVFYHFLVRKFSIFKVQKSLVWHLPGQDHQHECLPIFGAQEAVGHEAHVAVDQRQNVQQIGQVHVEHRVHIVGENAVEDGQDALGQLRHL